jgi:hypothetical protein
MIANIDRGENLIGALTYNQLKVDKENGQILFTHNMVETIDGQYSIQKLFRSFEPYLAANNRTEKPVIHISLNPDPREQVTDEKLQVIAEDYMEQMGYGNQPFVVFKHTDIDRSHIHIVSVCIDEEGRKISDAFEKRRSVKISRALEEKYGLLPMTEKDIRAENLIFRPVDYKSGDIKSQIASVVRYLPTYYRLQSLGEYNALLSLFNITAEEVKGELHGEMRRGLVYFALDENGQKASNPFKASLFGKQAGYIKLQDHLKSCAEYLKNESSKPLLKNTIEIAMNLTKDEIGFKKHLLDQGINTIVRRNAENRVYGITFIDHNSKIVWNGSRIGKELSAGIFNDWWNNNQKPKIRMNTEKKTSSPPRSKEFFLDEKPHNLFDFLDKTEPGFIEGMVGLLPDAQGDDFEEQLFENQIKRRKKRKRSG